MTLEAWIAVYGAGLSTILAILGVIREARSRREWLTVNASMAQPTPASVRPQSLSGSPDEEQPEVNNPWPYVVRVTNMGRVQVFVDDVYLLQGDPSVTTRAWNSGWELPRALAPGESAKFAAELTDFQHNAPMRAVVQTGRGKVFKAWVGGRLFAISVKVHTVFRVLRGLEATDVRSSPYSHLGTAQPGDRRD